MAARKQKAPEPATDGVLWRTNYTGPGAAPGGTPMRIELKDLTVQRLLQMKQWFGDDYAIPNQFIFRLVQQEAAATMCAVWIGLQKAKRAVADARELDFNFDEHFEALEDVQPADEEKKAPPTSDTGTTGSTGS